MTTTDPVLSGELVPAEPAHTLFRTDDPIEVLEAAKSIAAALGPALKQGGMTQRIGPSEHVKIEGWQTLGSMLGVTPHIVWSRPLPDQAGWEARAEARTLDGRPVGSAEGMCSRQERNWGRSEDYAIRSMAQTRAMSKALSGPLRFIVTLSGLSGTPAEEATAEAHGAKASPKEIGHLERAVGLLYEGDVGHLPRLLDRLQADAGGYLPKVVARAVMLVAAHRPGPPREADGAAAPEATTPPEAEVLTPEPQEPEAEQP